MRDAPPETKKESCDSSHAVQQHNAEHVKMTAIIESVCVRRQPNDHRIANFPLAALRSLHWDNASGGFGVRTFTFLYGYVFCNEQLDGDLAHSCLHGEGPHNIKVCVLKSDNPELYPRLVEIVGQKPKPPPSCREDTLRIVAREVEISGPDLRPRLESLGHSRITINIQLPRIEKRGEIISRRKGRMKVYRIGKSDEFSHS